MSTDLHVTIEVTDLLAVEEIRDSLGSGTQELVGGDGIGRTHSFFYSMPHPYRDCLVLALDGRAVGFLHGTDCQFTRSMASHRDQRGPFSLSGCRRREAGGSFRVFHIPRAGVAS